METKMKSKLLAILMSFVMAFTMIPMMGQTAYADNPSSSSPGMNLGADVLGAGSNTQYAAIVWMADVRWSVIGYSGTGVASSTDDMTLISSGNLKTGVKFRTGLQTTDANHYSKSNLKTEVEAVRDTFSNGEKEGIIARDLASGSNNGLNTDSIAGDEVKGALLWPLSTKEAGALDSDLRRLDEGTGRNWASDYWWLRSPGYSSYAAIIKGDGTVHSYGYDVSYSCGVRPAFNFNLESVIFTSAAEGGKTSGTIGADSLKQVETNTNNEWKMTVKDEAHKKFEVERVTTCDGKTLNINYSGAVKGDKEYISAIIKDKDGNVKYYGNLNNCTEDSDASGMVSVNADGNFGTEDTLYVFNERLNGDKKTDFASELKEVTIPQNFHDLTKTDKVDPTCTEQGKEAYWTCSICGKMFSDEEATAEITAPIEIPALNHNYGPWEKLDDEQHQRVCSHNKNHVEKENHKWDAGKVTKAATEQEEGVKTYTCTVCEATKTETIPKLVKIANPLNVKGKTATVKYSKLKKKTQILAVTRVIKFIKEGQGKMSYTLSTAKKGKKSFKKYFKINGTTGKVTVKKGLKKGSYKVKVKVKAAGNADYKQSVKPATFTVKVK